MSQYFRIAALALAFTAPALSAQQAKPAEAAHAHAEAPKMDAELTQHFKGIALSEAQMKQVMEIKTRHHAAMDALKKDAKDPADPALKAALGKHMAAEHSEFKALLTPAEYKKFEENMAAMHATEAKPGAMGEKHEMDHDMGGMKHDAKAEMKKKPEPTPKKP